MGNKELIDYFIERTDKRFDELSAKVDSLSKFKWQIIGGSAVISTLFSIGIVVLFGH